ncbi:MAG: hypothetical protein RL119_1050 [Actinomycetota bacterium]|jgi:endonuclease/exonuclease/phosphatase family metal-dependent hydrolase
MRILTWNLWWRFGPWEQRQKAIEEVLRRQEADVIFLQEVRITDGQAERLADVLGLSAVVSSGSYEMGNALISRWPIIEHDAVSLPDQHGNPAHRRALWALIETPWGAWPMISTHLDHRFDESATRQKQVDAVADLALSLRKKSELPVLIGGDFNAVPDSDEIRRLTGRSPVRHANLVFADMWELQGAGPGHTWSGLNPYLADANWPNRRLDYLFVSWPRPKPAGHPRQVWLAGTGPIDGVQASDHFAVVADVDVPDSETSVA